MADQFKTLLIQYKFISKTNLINQIFMLVEIQKHQMKIE